MSDLGELSAHHWHPSIYAAGWTHIDRAGPAHHWHPALRNTPDPPGPWLSDYANFAVHLEARTAAFTPIYSENLGPPWEESHRNQTDPTGRIYWHAHSIPIIWPVAAGQHTVTVTVAHDYPAPPYPTITIAPRADLGITPAPQTAAGGTTDPQELAIAIDAPTAATLILTLSCDNTLYPNRTIWGDITTT